MHDDLTRVLIPQHQAFIGAKAASLNQSLCAMGAVNVTGYAVFICSSFPSSPKTNFNSLYFQQNVDRPETEGHQAASCPQVWQWLLSDGLLCCFQAAKDNQSNTQAQGCFWLCSHIIEKCFQHSPCLPPVSGSTLWKILTIFQEIFPSSFLLLLASNCSMGSSSSAPTRASTTPRTVSKSLTKIVGLEKN